MNMLDLCTNPVQPVPGFSLYDNVIRSALLMQLTKEENKEVNMETFIVGFIILLITAYLFNRWK